MAPSITDLPDELLMNVISYLDLPSDHNTTHGWSKGDVRPTLCALAVTSRRLSTLAREFMLRDVKLATGWVSSLDPLYTTDRLHRFVRTCREKPETINCIRSLEMQADFSATPDWGISEDDKAPDLVLQMVSRSSSLSHLRLLLPGVVFLQWLPSLFPGYHKGELFACLQSFHLDCGNEPIPPPLFLYMCGLPSLKHIATPSPIKFGRHLKFVSTMTTTLGCSLSWSGNRDLRVETINTAGLSARCVHSCGLLEKMPKLQELHISVPGPGVTFDDHEFAHHKTILPVIPNDSEFSPIQQQMWLSPVTNTLRSLSMTNSRVLVRGHDGSLLDLSIFEKLQYLKLSIHFLCPASLQDARKIAQPNSSPCAPTKDFYRFLPPTLQTLEIHYDSDQGIFYDPHHLYKTHRVEDAPELNFSAARGVPKDQILPMMYNELWTDRINNVDGENGVQSRLGWLLALRHVRSKVLPKLTHLSVRETYAREWLWKDFDLVAQHPGFFSDEMSGIDIVLRVPKKWDPPVHSAKRCW